MLTFFFYKIFLRTFCASKVNERTLYNIYKSALNLENLILIDCGIRKLPENLFLYLPKVKVVDLRNNLLISLPTSLAYHPSIEVMMLSGNLFTITPPLLKTLPRLVKHDLTRTMEGIQNCKYPDISIVSNK